MAHRGDWGCFIDIPRARSNYTKYILNMRMGQGTKTGGGHALPGDWRKGEFTWAWVRRPDQWLRSLWKYHLDRDWKPLTKIDNTSPWATLCHIIQPFATDNFATFAEDIAYQRPGLATWFFRVLTPNWVTVKPCEEADHWLQKWFGITEFTEPRNTSADLPRISEKTLTLIKMSEHPIYTKYYGMLFL